LRFSQLNQFQGWQLAGCLGTFLLVAGCAAHKTAPTPTMIYPPTSETALRETRDLPPKPYDRLETITVAAEVGEQLDSAIKSARESAALKGADTLVVLQEKEFRQKVGQRTLKVRRITYLAIHRGGRPANVGTRTEKTESPTGRSH
jgi:hypothetical protein